MYHSPVSQERGYKMNGHTRLVRRNTTYYIRARIPSALVYLAKSVQFNYSLRTHNYYEALEKVRKESYKIDMKINLLRAIDMKIKNGELFLDDTDIDKLVIHKLEEVEKLFENNYEDIADGSFKLDDVKVFSPEKLDKAKQQTIQSPITPELKCVELYIREYFNDLKRDKRSPIQTVKMIGRLDSEDIKIISHPEKISQWVIDTKKVLKGVDAYIDKNTIAIQNGENVVGINQRVKRCIAAIELEKNTKAIKSSNTQTPWKRIFKDFAEKKRNNKISENSIKENELCLYTAFSILDKQYIENVTYQDCQKLSLLMYKLPKRWNEKYKPEELRELLKTETTNRISITSVNKYLRTFKEFLLYCKKRRFIPESFSDDIEVPKRRDPIKIDAFNREELQNIFNPSFYPPKNSIYYAWRYWIPLIGIYTGMRLNEICQLYVDDVRYLNRIWYFRLTNERSDQSLKNKQSKRLVPIHPKLIELGFIDFVKSIREAKKDRLFYQFEYSPKNHYTHAMSMWFARYLKGLGIEGRNKVFHSFRHTVKPYLRDAGISQEYQNAICGWSASDIGERVYGGEIPIKVLYQEISKLQYPFLDKNLQEIKKLNEK